MLGDKNEIGNFGIWGYTFIIIVCWICSYFHTSNNYFDRMIQNSKVDAYLKEKKEAVRIWKEIEQISCNLHFTSEELSHYVQTSCTYGRIKYELFAVSWQIMLYGYSVSEADTSFDQKKIDKCITSFDKLWEEWNDLAKENKDCPSIYKISSTFWGYLVGIKETFDRYRK